MEVVIIGKAWLGLDAGKESHWAHMLDAFGAELLSRKVENDEADLSKLINDALLLAEEVVFWAVDQPGGGAALLLALCCGSETRESSTSPLSPWIELAMPTGESPKPMPVMPASSLIRPG
jgi:Transposase